MEPLIDHRISDWIEQLDERFAKTGKQMDFAPWAVFVAYDIISEVGFGKYFFPAMVHGIFLFLFSFSLFFLVVPPCYYLCVPSTSKI